MSVDAIHTPLTVLDLIPRSSGATAPDAVRNLLDLARQTEHFGYHRYWFAEHHLNPRVLGVSPAVSIALVGSATNTIRLGSAGVQFGHRQPLVTVEEFGLLDAAFPGRLDLGVGRSIGRQKPDDEATLTAAVTAYAAQRGGAEHTVEQRPDNGLLLPKQYDFTARLKTSGAKVAALLDLLQQPGAYTPEYDRQIGAILELLAGTYVSSTGAPIHAYPGEGAAVQAYRRRFGPRSFWPNHRWRFLLMS